MSEWVSVLAVFWVLWALDGARLGPRRTFTIVGGACAWLGRRSGLRGARAYFSRLSLPGVLAGSWRMIAADVPVSLSPAGLCNRPAGAAGRPGEGPTVARIWRWEEVARVGVLKGWIFINDERFCPDTGHLSAVEVLALARMEPSHRETRIRARMKRWFRPGHLRRRVRVLSGRTRLPVAINGVTFAGMVLLTVYVVGDVASRIPVVWSERLVAALPAVLLGLLALHVVAVAIAWRGLRRLRAQRPEKRGANLFSALLLPPQALRLRALLGEGYFPAQHPLAVIVSFGRPVTAAEWGFNVLADLRWPLDDRNDPALAREVMAWFRAALETKVVELLATAGVSRDELLVAPPPDSPASCRYCPRCRDQFVAGVEACPHGVTLRPVVRAEKQATAGWGAA